MDKKHFQPVLSGSFNRMADFTLIEIFAIRHLSHYQPIAHIHTLTSRMTLNSFAWKREYPRDSLWCEL